MTATLDDIIDRATLEGLWPQAGVSHGLPRAAYVSDDFYRLGNERLFARGWTFIGFAHDIPEPGDVYPVTVAGLPILLVRDTSGGINAFHNVCRHRGIQLYDAPAQAQKSLTCPYHAWDYRLDGSLRASPHFGGHNRHDAPGFKREANGLVPVHCERWLDWIFVNVDSSATPFDAWIATMTKHLGAYDLESLVFVSRVDVGRVDGNWKLIIENYMEPYHVPVVHPETTAGQPLADHFLVVDGMCTGSGVALAGSASPEDAAASHGESDHLETNAYYLNLFPNFALHTYDDVAATVLVVPEAPDRSRQQVDIYRYGHVADDPVLVRSWHDLIARVMNEDRAIVERAQRGRASPVTEDGGVMSPHWESCVEQFHKLVIGAVGES